VILISPGKTAVMKIQRNYLLIFTLFLFSTNVSAQIPSTCFEIKSILVDACGAPEGANEMVSLVIGPADMNTADLSINWPNNPYRNICQDATTASKVATLNATIQACGVILEPVGGVLPAGSNVLIVTSAAMDPSFNSFANLTDTLYMIFQCSGNTSGHFKNYDPSSSIRMLDMSFTGFCSDQVSYDAANLLDQNGTPGAEDGATVNYDFAGNATYTNPGCQAPINALQVNVSANTTTICNGDLINVTAVISSGNFSSFFWTNGQGTYVDPSALSTGYQTNVAFQGVDSLRFAVIGLCNDTLFTDLLLNIGSGSAASISASGPTSFCAGDSVVLTASAGSTYSWSSGETSQSITVFTANTYTVTVTGSCGTSTASQNVLVDPAPVASISASGPTNFCQGGSVILTAAGSGPYLWSTGETTAGITVSTTGNYILSITNGCGTDTSSQSVSVDPIPVAMISGAPAVLCPNESATLTASGGTSYLWSTGDTTASILLTNGGNFSVTVSTVGCGSDMTGVSIGSSNLNVGFIPDTLSGAFPFEVNFMNTSFNAVNYSWDFGDGTGSNMDDPQHVYQSNGEFLVLLTGTDAQGCTDTASVVILVYDDTQITIPNVFTPNGDGKNEFFNVFTNKTNLGIDGKIFNRWGAEIATWNSLSGGWNGKTDGGSEAAEGVYVYIVKILFPDGKVDERNGAVSLIR
jgi:gliding motility-associated-like protein